MWKEIKAVWSASWADAKENWHNAWENSKDAIIAFLKAMAGYVLSVLQTVICIPLYTGIVKTGKIVVKWLIKKIMRI